MPLMEMSLRSDLHIFSSTEKKRKQTKMSASKRPKLENANIREILHDELLIRSIQNIWNAEPDQVEPKVVEIQTEKEPSGVQLVTNPFNVCIVRDILPEKLIRDIFEELDEVEFFEKSNDLYQFCQSDDVSKFSQPAIKNLYSVIKNDVLKWVEKVFVPSGLREHIAATFSSYSQGDHLLCHDDQCEDRHIAYVLYLTEGWTVEDGGTLDLFSTDENGDPVRPVLSLAAAFNTLVLFQVNSKSYHQVAEIKSPTKKRLSLNGWFHKADLPERIELPLFRLDTKPPSDSAVQLESFVFRKYLNFRNQLDIKNIFQMNSEIQLDNFIENGVFKPIMTEINSTDIVWKMTGPANMRHYEVAENIDEKLANLASLANCLQSKTWLQFLKKITGLDLAVSVNSDLSAWEKGVAPSCRVEIQRWLPGSYTLIHDRDPEFLTSTLDVFVRIPVCEGDGEGLENDTPQPGHIIYIDKDSKDEECLLHLGYKMNSLCMIFREPGTLRFTKYMPSNAMPFYQIQCMYIPWEPPEDEPDLKHVESEDEDDVEEDDYEIEGEVKIEQVSVSEESDSD